MSRRCVVNQHHAQALAERPKERQFSSRNFLHVRFIPYSRNISRALFPSLASKTYDRAGVQGDGSHAMFTSVFGENSLPRLWSGEADTSGVMPTSRPQNSQGRVNRHERQHSPRNHSQENSRAGYCVPTLVMSLAPPSGITAPRSHWGTPS
ncbi:unnamed protein product [Boreogadus saida]